MNLCLAIVSVFCFLTLAYSVPAYGGGGSYGYRGSYAGSSYSRPQLNNMLVYAQSYYRPQILPKCCGICAYQQRCEWRRSGFNTYQHRCISPPSYYNAVGYRGNSKPYGGGLYGGSYGGGFVGQTGGRYKRSPGFSGSYNSPVQYSYFTPCSKPQQYYLPQNAFTVNSYRYIDYSYVNRLPASYAYQHVVGQQGAGTYGK